MKVTRPPSPVTIEFTYEEGEQLRMILNRLVDYDRREWYQRRNSTSGDEAAWAMHFLKELK